MKNIRNFVCLSSILLAGWLGFTFFNKVQPHRYPTLGGVELPVSTVIPPIKELSGDTSQVEIPHEKFTAAVMPPIGPKNPAQ